MDIIYKQLEFHLAELLGWFGIVETPNGYIGYPEGSNPSKSFRSNIPQYIRNQESNSIIALTYDIDIEESLNYYSGETYVAYFKDHPTKQLAKQYIIVTEAIEKLEDDMIPDMSQFLMTDASKSNVIDIIQFDKQPFLIMSEQPVEVDY